MTKMQSNDLDRKRTLQEFGCQKLLLTQRPRLLAQLPQKKTEHSIKLE